MDNTTVNKYGQLGLDRPVAGCKQRRMGNTNVKDLGRRPDGCRGWVGVGGAIWAGHGGDREPSLVDLPSGGARGAICRNRRTRTRRVFGCGGVCRTVVSGVGWRCRRLCRPRSTVASCGADRRDRGFPNLLPVGADELQRSRADPLLHRRARLSGATEQMMEMYHASDDRPAPPCPLGETVDPSGGDKPQRHPVVAIA